VTNATGFGLGLSGESFGILHPEYLLLFPLLLAVFAWYLRKGGFTRAKLGFLAVRAVIILLIAAAMASPVHYNSRKAVEDVQPVTVLVDSSSSMGMYPEARGMGYTVFERVRAAVGNLSGKSQDVRIEFFSEGNRTAVGDAIYHSLVQYGGQPTSIILVSDGRNNAGRNPSDMAKIMAETNSTLYVLKPEKASDDLFIQSVSGDKKIPSNTQYDLLVRVGNTGFKEASYDLSVYVDDLRKFNKRFTQSEPAKDIPLSLSMKDIGLHTLKVEIEPAKGTFGENDALYKAVKVVQKPKILLVTANQTSPLSQVLERLYQVDKTRAVDQDYTKYTTVIFDNVNAADLDRNRVNRIRKYVLEGNGVAFVGGKNSFEYGGYNNSFVENLLPVKSTDKPAERRREFAVLFLIDISESTEYGTGKDSKIDVEKAVVLGMLRTLNANDSVGALAFNNNAYVISPVSAIGPKFDELQDLILRLRFGGGTDIQPALEAADGMLKDYTIDKYLIIVSDGNIRGTRMQLAVNKVAQMHDHGIKVFTAGVGFDTDEAFMAAMAQAGGGQYFSIKSDPQTRLKITFGEEADDKSKDRTPVIRADEYHYITRNLLELDSTGASVLGFNKVYEKNVAQMLLSTRGGKPILTVWRFGLGRVAALTTDNGLEWGQDLVKVDSGRVVSGMTNWVIGDLEKGGKVRVNSQDVHLGEPVSVTVTAQSQPQVEVKNYATMDAPQTILTRTGVMSYAGAFTPKEGGFYGIRATAGQDKDTDAVAVNYPAEYAAMGVDDDLLMRMAAATGSRLYGPDEADALVDDILGRLRESSTKELKDATHIWPYFAAIALAIYFADAAARRLYAILRTKGG
jgi:Mg-chelatase subunit ChlD